MSWLIRTVNRTDYRTDLWYDDFMARRKVGKESIRKIQKSSGSYYVRIPIGIVRLLDWQERQKVVIKKFGRSKIVIEDWKK